MKKILSLGLAFSLATSCGLPRKDFANSTTKQAAAACIITGPGAPICAVAVTAVQITLTLTIGVGAGAVIRKIYLDKDSGRTSRKITIAGDTYIVRYIPTPVAAPTPKVEVKEKAKATPEPSHFYCECTFSNGISAHYTASSLMMACGVAVGNAGVAACAVEKAKGRSGARSLNLIGSPSCLKIFGKSHRVSC